MEVYAGKVISIEKDKNYLNKKFAEVATENGSMFFLVKKSKVAIGDTVEIHKEENEMKYSKVVINGQEAE